MNDWQPIETAPTTGLTSVLLTDGTFVHQAYWSPGYPLHHLGWGYWEMGGQRTFLHPTHWMPLPKPPAADGRVEMMSPNKFPKRIYVTKEIDHGEAWLNASETTDEVDDGTSVGVYELKETCIKRVTHELKEHHRV